MLKFKKRVKIDLTFDRVVGHYNPLPTTLATAFPDGVKMDAVTTDSFTLTDTCTAGHPSLSGVTADGQNVTLTFADTDKCANGEGMTLAIDYSKLKMTESNLYARGSASFEFLFDSAAPTVSATIGAVSGIADGAGVTVSAAPSSVIYTFASDTDLDTVTAADFAVSGYGSACSTLPTVGTLVRDVDNHMVTVPLVGASCGDTEGFAITFAANGASDATMNGATGAAAAHTGPSSDYDVSVTVDFTVPPSVTSVGSGATSPSATYIVTSDIDIVVAFSAAVDVTGSPRIQLNATGSATRYATYSSGTGTNELTFRYTVVSGDHVADLDAASTSALALNGGTISAAGSGGGIAAVLTLPSPGGANSLGDERDIVVDGTQPTVSSASPSGTTYNWGNGAFDLTLTMSEEIDPASLGDSDLTITAGTCATPPTVTASALSGASNNVITFSLSDNTCAHNETYTLSFSPADVSDLNGNSGSGSTRNIVVTTKTTQPTLSLGSPSKTYVNAAATLTYTVTYSGASSVTLADGDVTFAGAFTDCIATVTGSGTTTRTISITGCSDNGAVQIAIAASTAMNAYGNSADEVDESAITDFNADNTPLTDPTHDLPTIGSGLVYNEDTAASFTLDFTGDVLGTQSAVNASLSLSCDSGGGGNAVTFTGTRSSNTLMTIAPNEAASDFTDGAECTLSGNNVPDAAGNTDTITPITFKVAKNPTASSGPSGTLSISTLSGTGVLPSVLFNVVMDTATVADPNVTFECNGGATIAISAVNASNGDKTFEVDFDENDGNWTSLSGGETCHLVFDTNVTSALGIPLSSTRTFTFTTSP